MSQHGANPETGPRLRSLLLYIRSRGSWGATTLEIAEGASVEAVSTCVSEVNREMPGEIVCRFERTTKDGRRIYRYWLKRFAPKEGAPWI